MTCSTSSWLNSYCCVRALLPAGHSGSERDSRSLFRSFSVCVLSFRTTPLLVVRTSTPSLPSCSPPLSTIYDMKFTISASQGIIVSVAPKLLIVVLDCELSELEQRCISASCLCLCNLNVRLCHHSTQPIDLRRYISARSLCLCNLNVRLCHHSTQPTDLRRNSARL